MGLREIESSLPPGFRFYPNDEELVCHYLYKKVTNHKITHGTMVEVDLHSREPWELPEVARLSENEWYFFSFRDRKYATGLRANRATKSGYWKATGKDRVICNPRTRGLVGMRKTLVFYQGRAPSGVKTSWVMHEFRLETPLSPPKEDWVLCRVFNKRSRETATTGGGYTASSSELPTEGSLESAMQGNTSNSFLNLALLHCDFFDFPPEMMLAPDLLGHGDGQDLGFFLDDEVGSHDKLVSF
ncbi:hypothetical protein HPP92_020469 [Vanilla planifolia]|uniref:NAC domain-containing protein n=1 Tax=Vanilla planifolia TaxID=51239 RepID=A0A835UHW8_VANPL|nr:hypothetical protein HPP92_020469 [Vanilla planifolia]